MIIKIKQFLTKLVNFFQIGGLASILGLLGAIAGQGLKWMKTFVIPFIIFICAFIETKNLWTILILSQIGIYFCGYGENSFLRKLFKNNNILTRGFISLLLSLSLLVLPILKNNWLYYIIGSLGIILTWAIISHQGFGEFKVKLFGKEYNCLKVDFVTYSLTAMCELLIIYK